MFKILSRVFFLVGGALVAFSFFSGGPSPVNVTEDDSSSFFEFLKGSEGKGVLGVGGSSSDDGSVCPKDKPVIGWMDYSGRKVVVGSVPSGQKPVCFESIEKANAEGFFASK